MPWLRGFGHVVAANTTAKMADDETPELSVGEFEYDHSFLVVFGDIDKVRCPQCKWVPTSPASGVDVLTSLPIAAAVSAPLCIDLAAAVGHASIRAALSQASKRPFRLCPGSVALDVFCFSQEFTCLRTMVVSDD